MIHRLRKNAPLEPQRQTKLVLGRGVAVAVAVGLGLSACSGSAPSGSEPAPAQASASAATPQPTAPSGEAPTGPSGAAPAEGSAEPSAGPDSGSTGTPAPPLPNPVTTPIAKAGREGAAQPSITAAAPTSSFSDTVTFSDGVALKIVKARASVEDGHGPGVFAGREFVAFDVEMSNGNSAPLDLSQVVVTAYYGGAKQLAAPVYTASAETLDFAGSLAPGAKATATYGFAIPKSDLGEVTLVVDFDGAHASAVYSGSVKLS